MFLHRYARAEGISNNYFFLVMKNYKIVYSFFCVLFIISFAYVTEASAANLLDHLHYHILVLDSARALPLQQARVALRKGSRLIAGKITDVLGRAEMEDIEPGTYTVTVSLVDYYKAQKTVMISDVHTSDTILLSTITQDEVVVGAEPEKEVQSIDIKNGAQVADIQNAHGSPSARMISVLQQNILGASRAPTGEIHIRGQHAEYSYYVDGILIQPGVFGGFNEVVEDKVIDRAIFYTGALPAEYGGPTAAVIDLQNRVPSGAARLDVETYAGSYLERNNQPPSDLGISSPVLKPINMNGQTISMSNHFGDLGVFISGNRQETDRRIDAPLPYIYHDHGFDYSLYGKLDYILGENDYITSNINWSKTVTELPFDPVEEGIKDDRQNTMNSFQTLSFYHTISREADKESDLFIGAFAREGSLHFAPGTIDPHSFYFADDTSTGYILGEDRDYFTYGIRTKWNNRFSHQLLLSTGLNLSSTSGSGQYIANDSLQLHPKTITSDFTGTDFGVFVQTEYHPLEWMRFDIGLRYDQQVAPDKPLQTALSPRFRWNIYPDDATSLYLSYGKYFIPMNIEELRSIANAAVVSDAMIVPTLAERDDAYEIGLLHAFDFGLHTKMDVFHKVQLPGVDDEVIGSTSIEAQVNIAKVTISGVEVGCSYSEPNVPWSGYINASLTHAYGSGAITGGFLPVDNAGAATDLDHDQRLSLVGSLTYEPSNWYATVTTIYGSGLTNGTEGYEYKTGLFDFNQGAHTTPSWIVNASLGYTFLLKGSELELSLFMNNIFDNIHLIKGSFFSGAAWEEPRSLMVKAEVHL